MKWPKPCRHLGLTVYVDTRIKKRRRMWSDPKLCRHLGLTVYVDTRNKTRRRTWSELSRVVACVCKRAKSEVKYAQLIPFIKCFHLWRYSARFQYGFFVQCQHIPQNSFAGSCAPEIHCIYFHTSKNIRKNVDITQKSWQRSSHKWAHSRRKSFASSFVRKFCNYSRCYSKYSSMRNGAALHLITGLYVWSFGFFDVHLNVSTSYHIF